MADPIRRRAFMSQWLAGTLAPGDRVIAGVPAVTGPSPHLDLVPALGAAVAAGIGFWRDFSPRSNWGTAHERVRLNVKARRAAFEDVLTAVRLHGGAVDVPALPVAQISL